jgi:hypothetical protein
MAQRLDMTRVDFERLREEGSPWVVRRWFGSWDNLPFEDELPETFDDEMLEVTLRLLSDAGYTASRWTPYYARAWMGQRGPTTRIDFTRLPDGRWRVEKWSEGWVASSAPTQSEVKDLNLEEALDWLLERQWIVRRWGAWKARAWFQKSMPVRNGGVILRMRKRLEDYSIRGGERPEWLPPDIDPVSARELDLAFAL